MPIFDFGKEKFNIENIMFNIFDIRLGPPTKNRATLPGNPAIFLKDPWLSVPTLRMGLALSEITSGEVKRIITASPQDVKQKMTRIIKKIFN